MSDLIDLERRNLQALFDPFNKGGSTLTISGGGHAPLALGIMEGYLVTRVAGDQFWVRFKALGYHDGFHHAHTAKIANWSQDVTWLLDLIDDSARQLHIELIFPELEPELAADWKRWRAYKAENRKRFQRIGADLLAEHARIAENWG